MEDIFTIKVKTEPDTRNLYPSERRYSASTVSGLAWVHLALGVTSFIMACLAIVNPTGSGAVSHLTLNDAVISVVDRVELLNTSVTDTHEDLKENATEGTISYNDTNDYIWILVIAPSLLTIASLAAGIASIMASSRWYVDRNITWLFLMSILSTTLSAIAFVMIIFWIWSYESNAALSGLYRDKVSFEDYIVISKSNIVDRNDSHIIISDESAMNGFKEHVITKRFLSINVLILCFVECLWSVLSLKISYKGMITSYRVDDDNDRGGNCLEIVTTVKGNKPKTNHGKLFTPPPDLINHYPSNKKIKRFLQSEANGLKGEDDNTTKSANENGSEYRVRMMNFLDRCDSFDGSDSGPDVSNAGVERDAPATIQEVDLDSNDTRSERAEASRVSTISWGDPRDHTVYNQNNLDLEKILKGTIVHSDEACDNDDLKGAKENITTAEVDDVKPIETVEES